MGFFGMRLYLYQAPLFDRAYDSGMWLAWRYPFVPSEDGGRAMRFYSIPSGVSKPGRGGRSEMPARGMCPDKEGGPHSPVSASALWPSYI